MNFPVVKGILETALYVADLDVSENFYVNLFHSPILVSDERMRAIALQSDQILLLFKIYDSVNGESTPGGFIPGHDGRGNLHVCFKIEENTIDAWIKRLGELSIKIISEVMPSQGGRSIYFNDPDNHVIELATSKIWKL